MNVEQDRSLSPPGNLPGGLRTVSVKYGGDADSHSVCITPDSKTTVKNSHVFGRTSDLLDPADTSDTALVSYKPEEVIIDGFSILSFKTEAELLQYSQKSDKDRQTVTNSLNGKSKRSRRNVNSKRRQKRLQDHDLTQSLVKPITSTTTLLPINGYVKPVPLEQQNGYLPRSASANGDFVAVNSLGRKLSLSCDSCTNQSDLESQQVDDNPRLRKPHCSGSPGWNHVGSTLSCELQPSRKNSVLSNALDCHLTPLSTSWNNGNSITSPNSPSTRWSQMTLLERINDSKSPHNDPMVMPALEESPVRQLTVATSTPTPTKLSTASTTTCAIAKPPACHLFSVAALTDKIPDSNSSNDQSDSEIPKSNIRQINLNSSQLSPPQSSSFMNTRIDATQRINGTDSVRFHPVISNIECHNSPKRQVKRDHHSKSKPHHTPRDPIRSPSSRPYPNHPRPQSSNKARGSPRSSTSTCDIGSSPNPSETVKQQLPSVDAEAAERLLNHMRFSELYSLTMAALAGAEARTPGAQFGSVQINQTESSLPFAACLSSSLTADNNLSHLASFAKSISRSSNASNTTLVTCNADRRNTDNTKLSTPCNTSVAGNFTSDLNMQRTQNLLHSAYNNRELINRVSSFNSHLAVASTPVLSGLPPPPPLTAGRIGSDSITDTATGPQRSLSTDALQHFPPPPLYGLYQQPGQTAHTLSNNFRSPPTSHPVVPSRMEELIANHDKKQWDSLMKTNAGSRDHCLNLRIPDSVSSNSKLGSSFPRGQPQRIPFPSTLQRSPTVSTPAHPNVTLPLPGLSTRSVYPAESSKTLLPMTSILYRPVHPGRVYAQWADAHIRIAHHILQHQASLIEARGRIRARRKNCPTLPTSHSVYSTLPIRPVVHSVRSPVPLRPPLGFLAPAPITPASMYPFLVPASSSQNLASIRPGSHTPWSSAAPPSQLGDQPDERNVFLNYLLTGLLSHVPQNQCNDQRASNETNDVLWQAALQRFYDQSSSIGQSCFPAFPSAFPHASTGQNVRDLSTTSRISGSAISGSPAGSSDMSLTQLDAKRQRFDLPSVVHSVGTSQQSADMSTRTSVLPPELLNRFTTHPVDLLTSSIPKPNTNMNALSTCRFPGLYANQELGLQTDNDSLRRADSINLKFSSSHLPPINPW